MSKKLKGDLLKTLKSFEKKTKNEIFEPCHRAKKHKRETLQDFLNIHSVAKYQKNEGEPFSEIKKIEKKSHSGESNRS